MIWVFDFIKSVCFLKILATACRIDERKSQALPFESISQLSAARSRPLVKSLFGCRRNDFLAVEEMNCMTETDLVD